MKKRQTKRSVRNRVFGEEGDTDIAFNVGLWCLIMDRLHAWLFSLYTPSVWPRRLLRDVATSLWRL